MKRSAEWVVNWTDLILDSSALREAADKGDLDEVRARTRAIASRARRQGYVALALTASVLLERLGFPDDVPPSVVRRSTEEILRHVDAINQDAG
jgi:hypothetical protein